MVRVRMIEAQQLGPQFRRAPLGLHIVLVADTEATPRPFLGDVRQREGIGDDPVRSIQRAAAFVRIRLRPVGADRFVHSRSDRQRHHPASALPRFGEAGAAALPRFGEAGSFDGPPSSQNRSDRYFSPPSQKTTTITASLLRRATDSAPARFAPLEMPTNNPLRASSRVSWNASSVLIPMSSSAMVAS